MWHFVIFIDDYSRKCWIYFLKQKSEVAATFEEFKALVENQAQTTIKVFRIDNGGEYISKAFQDFYKQNGIIHKLTTPYTP